MHLAETSPNSARTAASAAVIIALLGCAATHAQKHQKGQYKKQNRQQVTAIARGDAESALEYSKKYLATYPEDIEAWYIQTLAYSQVNETDKAMDSLRKALELGMPLERILAGPRNLFEPVYQTDEFRALSEGAGVAILHGPVVGAVTSTSVRFWVRTASEQEVRVQVSPDSQFKQGVISGAASSRKQDDYTCVIQVEGLSPVTSYFYRLESGGNPVRIDPVPNFRTSPRRGSASRFSIGFGGGAGYTPWHEHMWLTILEHSPQAFLLLGDNVYIDTPEVPETQRYCYYRRQSRPEYRTFAAATPVCAIWDDHDFGTNDCTSTLEIDSPPWKRDVLEVFRQNFVNPYYGGGEQHPGCWFDFSMGNVDFFMLDCRFYRQNPKKNENPSMLGPFQKQWLFQKLRNSTAAFKVIASSVPWSKGIKGKSKDPWDGFPEEREEIFSFIEENDVDGVLLLAADRHRSDARKTPRKNGYDLYEFMSSKLTNIHTHGLVENAKGSEFIFGYNSKCSFGVLTFDTTKSDPEVTYRVINIDNKEIDSLTLKRSQLQHPDE